MNGFELVMADGHFDQWVRVVVCMQIVFPVGEQVANNLFTNRWGVDGFTGCLIANDGPEHLTYIHIHAFQRAAHLYSGARAQWFALKMDEALIKGCAISERFFGGRIGPLTFLRKLKQFVGGGDDVLDLGTVFGFQQWQKVYQQ